ncbi:GNAT family acetyltransferase, partial [Phytophthora palmivora]
MLNGPFKTFNEFEAYCLSTEKSREPQIYAIVVDGHAVGMIAYMQAHPSNGIAEVGRIYYTSKLQKTPAATEAMYLLIANAFKLGYRRYEWKCDSCNLASRNAATRYGFTYEGLFRQAMIYKSRNRDTTQFSIIDVDWNGGLNDAYKRWLKSSNFDENGQQILRLSELTAPFRGDVESAITQLGGVQQCPEGINARVTTELLEDDMATSCKREAAGYDVKELLQPSQTLVTPSKEHTTSICRYRQSQMSFRSLAETLLRIREDLLATGVGEVTAPNASLFREFYKLNQLANLMNIKEDVLNE